MARAKPGQEGCRFPDLIDLSNGQQLETPRGDPYNKDLTQTKVPRFCDEVRYGKPQYSRLFKLVMENPTFRVYKVT